MKSLRERFENKYVPEPNTGCWLWLSTINSSGYGEFWANGSWREDGTRIPPVRAHRFSYEFFRGPIPEGLQIDHRCRTRSCVNPDHLEPVTNQENVRRGWASGERTVTHCKRGHELSGDNLYLAEGRRHCRTCRAERAIAMQQAKTHCKYGHPLSGDNLSLSAYRRTCRTCRQGNANKEQN